MDYIEDRFGGVVRNEENSGCIEIENVMLVYIEGGEVAPDRFGSGGDRDAFNIFFHIMYGQQQNKMSHLRNRHFKTAVKINSQTNYPLFRTRNSSPQVTRLHGEAAQRIKTEPDWHMKSLYNQNISMYRTCFDQNDASQLPFMATLRAYPHNKKDPKPTMSEPFEAALKTTCNQKHKKKVSDFSSRAHRLAYASYRWHNRSGRGSLWGTDFECSLRKYEENRLQRESNYYSYIAPIHYQEAEQRVYDKSQMVCDHYRRSFKIGPAAK